MEVFLACTSVSLLWCCALEHHQLGASAKLAYNIKWDKCTWAALIFPPSIYPPLHLSTTLQCRSTAPLQLLLQQFVEVLVSSWELWWLLYSISASRITNVKGKRGTSWPSTEMFSSNHQVNFSLTSNISVRVKLKSLPRSLLQYLDQPFETPIHTTFLSIILPNSSAGYSFFKMIYNPSTIRQMRMTMTLWNILYTIQQVFRDLLGMPFQIFMGFQESIGALMSVGDSNKGTRHCNGISWVSERINKLWEQVQVMVLIDRGGPG